MASGSANRSTAWNAPASLFTAVPRTSLEAPWPAAFPFCVRLTRRRATVPGNAERGSSGLHTLMRRRARIWLVRGAVAALLLGAALLGGVLVRFRPALWPEHVATSDRLEQLPTVNLPEDQRVTNMTDQVELWLAGEYVQLPLRPETVERQLKHVTLLQPARRDRAP